MNKDSAELAAFENWYQDYRRRSWAGGYGRTNPPPAGWAAHHRPLLLEGWQARAALDLTPAPLPNPTGDAA